MIFSNPVPVGVALVPYQAGLVGVRRAIEPKKDLVAFPGGYINSGESFHEALSRELNEETGLIVDSSLWKILCIGDSIISNRILLFAVCPEIKNINFSFRSNETSEIIIIDKFVPLAFPLHEVARNNYFKKP
jgi:8-oxo-dGTP pyrophosphatase MutT (NUDIX family)